MHNYIYAPVNYYNSYLFIICLFIVILIITLLVLSVSSQTIEFDASLDDTIYVDVSVTSMYVAM